MLLAALVAALVAALAPVAPDAAVEALVEAAPPPRALVVGTSAAPLALTALADARALLPPLVELLLCPWKFCFTNCATSCALAPVK